MTDRDQFAAAALTGLLAQGDDGSFSEESYVRGAYRWADAMLRERERTNHDAAPAARAGTPGTGDTPKPIKGDVSDRSKPITGPDPDSRVWETHTPATHATPGEGSVPREGTQEPVAWAVRYRHGDTGIVDLCRTLADCRAKWSNRTTDYWLYEPLYRQAPDFAPPPPDNAAKAPDNAEPVAWAVCTPSDGHWSPCYFHEPHAQRCANAIVGEKNVVALYRKPTLTDAEREDMECAASRLWSDANGPRDLQVADTLRGLLERLGGGR